MMLLKVFDQNIWGNYGATECVGNRNKLVANIIRENNADVCCFQECNPSTSRAEHCDISSLLSSDYLEVPTNMGVRNFTPIFYRFNKLSVVESGWEKFEGKNDIDSKSSTWCVFEDKESGIRFAWISTHFWWASNGQEDNLQRLQNVEQICSLAIRLKDSFNVPVFFSGDLNCGENSQQGVDPLNKIKSYGFVDLRDVSKTVKGFYTVHEYPIRDMNDNYFGNSQPYFTLDHAFMFPNQRVFVNSFSIDTSDRALSTSDHCPITISMEII